MSQPGAVLPRPRAAGPERGGRARGRVLPALAAAAGLLALSAALRLPGLGAGLWIDEGLSWGISSHPLLDVPGVLRQDGSPPLYYMLLNVWMGVFGDGEQALHALSLIMALAAVPAALWTGWTLFGARAGVVCGALAATLPYLTFYAREARMYALVALLSVLLCATFAHAFALRRRRVAAAFALVVALLLYTHVWSFFLVAGSALALVPCLLAQPPGPARRLLVRDAALAFGAAFALYAPWLPTLVFQARHTGAPWALAPGLDNVLAGLEGMSGGEAGAVAVLIGAGAGLARIAERERGPHATAVLAIGVIGVAALALAFLASQVSPAWAYRYFAIFVGPLVLLAGVGIDRAGRLGAVVLVLLAFWWAEPRTVGVLTKSNVRTVAGHLDPLVGRGDLVLSTHPERIPVLRYYLGPEPSYATTVGRVPDPLVMDWRDALERYRAADPRATAERLVRGLRPGARIVLIRPIIRSANWDAPWTELVRERSAEWNGVLARDPRLVRVHSWPHFRRPRLPHGVRATVYRVRGPAS